MDRSLLDTDILSEILKAKNPQVLDHARRYLAEHGRFTFSAFTLYEIMRGFRANGAIRQLDEFQKLTTACDVLPISETILHRAAELWADARHGGHPRNDADLIIAATALDAGLVLVTGNQDHFAWIPRLILPDWRARTG